MNGWSLQQGAPVCHATPFRRAPLPKLTTRRRSYWALAAAAGLRPRSREEITQAAGPKQQRSAPSSREEITQAAGPKQQHSAPSIPAKNSGPSRNEHPVPAVPLPEIPIVRSGQASSSRFFTSKKFAEIGASDEVINALASVGITRPSHIQAAGYKALTSSARHVILADHAGSGKTLAYLLPLIQQLKEEERQKGRVAPHCPRIVVVVPTAELCSQVVRVCRALSRSFPFRSLAATGGHKLRTQKDALAAGVDVLVATPGRLQELLMLVPREEGEEEVDRGPPPLRLDDCSSLVLDEVDVLLGDTSAFADQVRPLRAVVPPGARFVFVTATITDLVFAALEEEFPGIVAAFGPGLHRTAPGVEEQLVDCSGGDEVNEESGFRRKAEALLTVLEGRRAERAIVFCNKIETCRKVENFLNRSLKGKEGEVEVLPYHAAIADEKRDANLRVFLALPASETATSRGKPSYHRQQQQQQQQGKRMILVCTDRASRGVDSAYVDHVVLFDFPRDPSEYVRRVGRTARGATGTGLVTILALGRQVKLAQDIINRNQKGIPVHKVPDMPLAGAVVVPEGRRPGG